MPLCVFDEVEAALDTANVERFAKYISHFKDGSQFIVVTHRPGPMEQWDALYGVTMKQKGVSSLLKVQLSEAMAYVEQNGGNLWDFYQSLKMLLHLKKIMTVILVV